MAQEVPFQPASAEKTQTESIVETPQKSSKEIKRQRKKKSAAFQSFLTAKTETQEISPTKRKMSGEEEIVQEKLEEDQNCKICHLQLAQKRKVCQFCKDTVCLEHIRKKRKYKNTNKFARICDDCEDKYIYDKYMKLEMKAQESLNSQDIIISAKHMELADIIGNKLVKVQLLNNKKKQFEDQKKANQARYNNTFSEYSNRLRKFESKKAEADQLGASLQKIEKQLPRPLQDDYNALLQENSKITKELVKYEKLCNEAIKAKSNREKQMYEEYYQWQKKQSEKKAVTQKKGQECAIY